MAHIFDGPDVFCYTTHQQVLEFFHLSVTQNVCILCCVVQVMGRVCVISIRQQSPEGRQWLCLH